MLFNTVHFLIFFVIVTLAYFSLGWSGRWRLLLLASCYFYMIFKPIYFLILLSTIIIDYIAGILLENEQNAVKRKLLLVVSLISNIGILVYFKYFNFLNNSLTEVLSWASMTNPIKALDILLPVGLSFHTFQAMSYTIEVYRGNHKAERHFGIYALYVMFYPQLVAGPIERPQNVLYQFHQFHQFNWEKVKSGLFLIVFGLFKKVVIADRLAMLVDHCYNQPENKNGLSLLLATFFYTFQIYCDFSGYSEIALGTARVMGFELMENFHSPYFSSSISEFWRRWHISLSSWFRDYLYIPLGGNRVSEFRKYLNQFIVFMVSGLWHGANWTFVIWGSLHGFYLIVAIFRNKYFPNLKLPQNLWGKTLNVLSSFILVMLAWVFFRAKNVHDATVILRKISFTSLTDTLQSPLNQAELIFCFMLIALLMIKDWKFFYVDTSSNKKFWLLTGGLAFLTYFLGVFETNQFIYFQF